MLHLGQYSSCFGRMALWARRLPVRALECFRLGTAMIAPVPGVNRHFDERVADGGRPGPGSGRPAPCSPFLPAQPETNHPKNAGRGCQGGAERRATTVVTDRRVTDRPGNLTGFSPSPAAGVRWRDARIPSSGICGPAVAYVAYEGIPMLRNPDAFKGEERFLMRCWITAASAATVIGFCLLVANSLKRSQIRPADPLKIWLALGRARWTAQ
jgi:hypothetical protein